MNINLNLEDFELVEIESIELMGEMETIDITVEGTHMFFANDIYTHNSGSNVDVGDISFIGKAIEPFQVADQVGMYTQTPDQYAEQTCIYTLLKNRLGPKNIVLECFYDPNQGVFKELKEVPELLMLSNKEKKQVSNTVSNLRDKLKSGVFDKK